MLAALPSRPLTVRTTDDAGIALLDAWAVVADIVTFYQERIANEGFLRTATERRSVLELARAIGYELHPGVAASTYLAFTVETAPGAPASAIVARGTKVRSIPGQNQRPQTFETSEEITALAERNELRLRRHRPQIITRGLERLYLRGVDTGLRPGDAILVVGDERRDQPGSERWDFRLLRSVEPLPSSSPDEPSTTLVTWDIGLGMARQRPAQPATQNVQVYAFRLRAALFGHNAPAWRTMPDNIRARYAGEDHENVTEWPSFELPGPGQDPVIDLDAAYAAIMPGSWLVLQRPGYKELYRVTRADLAAREDFGITGKTTRLRLDAEKHLSWFGIRATAVYAQTEQLELADEPITDPVAGPRLALDRTVPLDKGRPLIVTGTTEDKHTVTEVVRIADVTDGGTATAVTLESRLSRPLDTESVRILGNVVAATHGEATEEVLGSGDGSATHRRFTLAKPDLTHVSATSPRGVVSTLVVRLDDVAWVQTPSLFLAGPHDASYVVRIDDGGRATVVFGDGERGARLPSRQENIRAVYRSGIGPEGNVEAGALSLLQQRPLGIGAVSNPLPAAGGTASEQLEDARGNAPLTVSTLDRVVSLRDHEDFARAFGGIAKARATALWGGAAFFVHVTVAAPEGAEVDAATLGRLRVALDEARDRTHDVRIESYVPAAFGVAVAVLADGAFVAETVRRDVGDALRTAYAFDRRGFAQPVTAVEVLTAVQGVRGVVAANLVALHPVGTLPGVEEVIVAHEARVDATGVTPAELLLVDPGAVMVTEMAP